MAEDKEKSKGGTLPPKPVTGEVAKPSLASDGSVDSLASVIDSVKKFDPAAGDELSRSLNVIQDIADGKFVLPKKDNASLVADSAPEKGASMTDEKKVDPPTVDLSQVAPESKSAPVPPPLPANDSVKAEDGANETKEATNPPKEETGRKSEADSKSVEKAETEKWFKKVEAKAKQKDEEKAEDKMPVAKKDPKKTGPLQNIWKEPSFRLLAVLMAVVFLSGIVLTYRSLSRDSSISAVAVQPTPPSANSADEADEKVVETTTKTTEEAEKNPPAETGPVLAMESVDPLAVQDPLDLPSYFEPVEPSSPIAVYVSGKRKPNTYSDCIPKGYRLHELDVVRCVERIDQPTGRLTGLVVNDTLVLKTEGALDPY